MPLSALDAGQEITARAAMGNDLYVLLNDVALPEPVQLVLSHLHVRSA